MRKGVKVLSLFLFSLVIVSVFATLVSADGNVGTVIQSNLDSFVEDAKPILSWIIGDVNGDGELLLIKFLFLVIILAMVFYAVRAVPIFSENLFLVWIISLAVSFIAVRFIRDSEWVNFIWLPYGTLGVVLATVLPFILFFFFIENFRAGVIRRTGWIAFAVIFFGLAAYRWDDFSYPTASGGTFNLAWLYIIIAGLSLIMTIFDKYVHARMILLSEGKKTSASNILIANHLSEEIAQWEKVLANPRSTSAEIARATSEITKLQNRIAKLP